MATIGSQLSEYASTWEKLTGFKPSAMPIAPTEIDSLRNEFESGGSLKKMRVKDHDCVVERMIVYEGIDLYITPEAKAIRDALIHGNHIS